MRLKLFEEHNLYQSLKMNQFDSIVLDDSLDPNDNLLGFTELEINKINNYIRKSLDFKFDIILKVRKSMYDYTVGTQTYIDYNGHDPFNMITNFNRDRIIELNFSISEGDISLADTESHITIYKLPDEWYMIRIYGYDQYKCDQFDGLCSCLDEYLSDNYKN